MSQVKIESCVFDFGGVMSPALYPDLVKKITDGLGLDWKGIVEGFVKYRRIMDGDLITLAEMYGRTFRDMGVSLPEEVLQQIYEADSASYFSRNEDTLEWMRSLKNEGYSIGILTNMNSPFANRHFRRIFADFIELADAVVISGEEHLYKPMREIYDITAKRLGVNPSKICFFDDVEENCKGARIAGWKAIRFNGVEETKREFSSIA